MSTPNCSYEYLASLPLDLTLEAQLDQDSDGLVQFYDFNTENAASNEDYIFAKPFLEGFASIARTVYPANATKVGVDPQDPANWFGIPKQGMSVWQVLSNFAFGAASSTDETFEDSYTQVEFNTKCIQLIMDILEATAIPESVITSVNDFLKQIGSSIQVSWHDKSKDYKHKTVSICHEMVTHTAADGSVTYDYVGKLKMYYIAISASNKTLTSFCGSVEKVDFKFDYHYEVMAWNIDQVRNDSKLKESITNTINSYSQQKVQESNNYLGGLSVPASSNASKLSEEVKGKWKFEGGEWSLA